MNLRVGVGEMVALIGASGSGKSTLLRHIAGFIAADPQPSQIEILGRPIQHNGRIVREVRRIRRDIGFVFQQFNLVNRLTVETNVLIGALARLPLWRRLTGYFPRSEREFSAAALAQVGIGVVLYEEIRSFDYAQTSAVLIMVIAVVTVIDLVSAKLRSRVI